VKVDDFQSDYDKLAEVFHRMIDIRGDLYERGTPFLGDHPGTWYRIWGTMLYDLDRSPIDQAKVSAKDLRFAVARGVTQASAAIDEQVIKFFKGGDQDGERKLEYDQAAADAMYHAMMTYLGAETPLYSCTPDTYLDAER
jgi:hypothetical protein